MALTGLPGYLIPTIKFLILIDSSISSKISDPSEVFSSKLNFLLEFHYFGGDLKLVLYVVIIFNLIAGLGE